MTVIAAFWDEGKGQTWIASDSLAVNCDTKMYGVPKWVVARPWAVGIAGNNRAINIIAAHSDDIFHNLAGAVDFTNRARSILEDDGFLAQSSNEAGPKDLGQQMILAHPGGLWSICVGFSVIEIPPNTIWADGSGRAYALGAGYVAKGAPKQRLMQAIECANHYSDSCGGDVFVDVLKRQ